MFPPRVPLTSSAVTRMRGKQREEGGRKRKKKAEKGEAAFLYDRLDKITSPLITVYANNDKGDGAEVSC